MSNASAPVIHLLGPVTIAKNAPENKPVAIGPQAANLLISLALSPGQSLSATALADDVWPNDPPANPRRALGALIARIRAAAGNSDIIEAVPNGFRLRAQTDLSLLTANPDELDELWQGEPGTGASNEELRQALITDAERLRSSILRQRATEALAIGDLQTAHRLAADLIPTHPYDDSLTLLGMKALTQLGRQAEALDMYAAHAAILREDLGTDPDEALALFHRDLLRQQTAPHQAHSPHRMMRTGLRQRITPLIGRDKDLHDIHHLLISTRLVSVIGPGGMGKTSIAQQVGSDIAQQGHDVAFIELAAVETDDDVSRAVASTLGLHRTLMDGEPLSVIESTVEALRGTPTPLLILDNCEHVLGGAAHFASDVLAASDSIRVLATSRAPLGILDEAVFRLPPLPSQADGENVPAAVSLFEVRARAVRADADLPRDVVTELTTRLDGLPLAIELAAARLKTMSVREIADQLNDVFSLLVSTSATVEERHRRLEAVIAWSWSLLAPTQQRLARQLAVFPSSVTLTTACAVMHDHDATKTQTDVEALIDQSLLSVEERPGSPVRFHMLETVKEYALTKASTPDDLEDARSSMAEWAADYAVRMQSKLCGTDQPRTFAQFTQEVDNLVGALRESTGEYGRHRPRTAATVFGALSVYAMGSMGPLAAVESTARIMETCEDYTPTPDDAEAAAVGFFFGGFTRDASQGMPRQRAFDTMFNRALAAGAPSPTHPEGTVRPGVRAMGELFSKAFEDWRNLSSSMTTWMDSQDDSEAKALALLMLALATENSGNLDRSYSYATACFETAQSAHLTWLSAQAAVCIAGLASQRGATTQAVHWANVGNDLITQLGHTGQDNDIGQILASSALTVGDFETARQGFEALAAIDVGTAPDTHFVGEMGLGEVDLATGNEASGLARLIELATDARIVDDVSLGPWLIIVGAVCLSAYGLSGHAADPELDSVVRYVVDNMEHTTSDAAWDMPITGTAAVGLAGFIMDKHPDQAAGLLALAERMSSRQDMYSLIRERHWTRLRESGNADLEREIRAQINALDTSECAQRAIEIAQQIVQDL